MEGDAHPTKLALRDRRERVIAQLTESFARDELSLDGFDARIEAAFRCPTIAELDALVADLAPAVAVVAEIVRDETVAQQALALADARPVVRAVFSNVERRDRVAISGAVRVEAIFGNVEIDLRDAVLAPDAELHVRAIFGSIEILVPADVAIRLEGGAVFGNFEGATVAVADPEAPVLRVVGSSIFASVVVRTVPPLRVERRLAALRARPLLPR